MKQQLIIALLLAALPAFAQQKDLVAYANTLQGTNSEYALSNGNTYPTTSLPFGMHAWSPQTGKNGDGWKYQYKATTIRGFQQAHQCSPWVGDYAVFTLMPVAGELKTHEDERAAAFSHDRETARPDYYKVTFDNHTTTELTTTERGAHLRFSFPARVPAHVVLDGYNALSGVRIYPSERKITGYVTNGRFIPKNFRNYFVIVFDQPFESFGTWENVHNRQLKGNDTLEAVGAGAYITFRPGSKVSAKVASSYISAEQAETTLQQELGRYRSFTDTRSASQKIWNTLFRNVLVEGGTQEELATFYSCLFRANLFSHQFFEYDQNGKPYYFSPYDGKVHNGYMYTDNGFWDTFRAQFPLNTILHPTMTGRYMQALLDAQQQCGWLPAWSFPGETGGMLGNHAISLLTDAWVKGIRTFDPKQALDAYFHEAMNKGPWGGANGRAGWKEYYQLGYVAFPESHGSTSQTLEYAYDDFCGYQLAKLTGQTFYAQLFARTMLNYKNQYDSTTGFMRGRKLNGDWLENFDPYEWGGPYTEGNAWHWQWSVFHDVRGLINLMGGEQPFLNKLDSLFTAPPTVNVGYYKQMIHEMTEMVNAKMGQYAHGNQPVQHAIYLYNYTSQPWKAQALARKVMANQYNAGENGFPGDEDQGQMSSWYVMSALGFYSVCPGTDEYVIGSPVFGKATIKLENGNTFLVEARNNNAQNVYIQSATLNGKPYTHHWIRHSDIMAGGTLVLEMGDKPATGRGLADADQPFSLSRP
ncbi:GH92 family glycosyl hydrolase [Chitinophaga horti]|uniref:GH92 family glycosyl hydrolase n=1 Tax=Chitinophaga horti TaxID=2920382 RepID=A0ABY6J439_9BACT|nr:GH92 family glycosyl hydrolase [Chitinophaga horti]UYQ94431.1 GH92 family glycosyl hydrolase [Chitinophaga horti]